MSSPGRQPPASWAAYDRGGRHDSTDSGMSYNRVTFGEEGQGTPQPHHNGSFAERTLHSHRGHDTEGQQPRRRRSSLAIRLNAVRSAGGVNSLDNFARSWQRAAGFYEITAVRQSFRYGEDEENIDQVDDARDDSQTGPMHERSLLRQNFMNEGRTISDDVVEEEQEQEQEPEQGQDSPSPITSPSRIVSEDPRIREQTPLLRERASRVHEDGIFRLEPQLSSPFGGSYGSTWSSMTGRLNEPSMRHAGRLFRQQQAAGTSEPDKEREPLFVKQVQEEDGRVVNVVVGHSTLPQTVFNSVNVLIGVGLLALPLALRYAGWIPGLIFLTFAAIATQYTAKLLAKCADVDNTLITFADLAYVSFGPSARVVTSILFSVELLGACVALVVLFAESLDALVPGWGVTEWKVVCGLILIPLGFLPLRLLSFTSILGILSCFSVVSVVLIGGLVKPDQPGSLRQPAETYIVPQNWGTLPIAFGLLMAPWGGHSVFPNIYRDMRHPYKYQKALNITYGFTFTLDTLMAIIGYVMFGDGAKDIITNNIVTTEGFPRWISIFIVICIAVIPITKVPLNARPIVSTVEISLGLDSRVVADTASLTGLSGITRGCLKVAVRVLTTVLFVLLAILVPDFDRIMSLVGAVAGFTICIVLPCAFHLKLFGKELSRRHKALDWSMIVVSSVLALVSTAFNFVPKDALGL